MIEAEKKKRKKNVKSNKVREERKSGDKEEDEKTESTEPGEMKVCKHCLGGGCKFNNMFTNEHPFLLINIQKFADTLIIMMNVSGTIVVDIYGIMWS